MQADAAEAVTAVYRSDWSLIVATLIRLVGDFDVAEEAAQEAFTAAVDHWRVTGVPEFPRAWLIKTAHHKAIDRLRRRARFEAALELNSPVVEPSQLDPEYEPGAIQDDRLRLIFTCCHPALAPEAQVALTLRTLCGLLTDEIARESPKPCRWSKRRCAEDPDLTRCRRRSRPSIVRPQGRKTPTGRRSCSSTIGSNVSTPQRSCR